MLGINAIAQDNFYSAPMMEQPFDSIFTSVEQMPQYVGGEAEMMKFIDTHIKYPPIKDELLATKRDSVLTARFVVDKTGKIRDIRILAGANHTNYAKSFVTVIEQMPNWIPGKQNNKLVDVYYIILHRIGVRE